MSRKPRELKLNSTLSFNPVVWDVGKKLIALWADDKLKVLDPADVTKIRKWLEGAEAWQAKK